jgi:hypothetical protein
LFPLFATGINSTSGTGGKFATSVVDTGGKLATGEPRLANISANLKKNRSDPNVISGAWGKMIHEKKTFSKKSPDTVPLHIVQ